MEALNGVQSSMNTVMSRHFMEQEANYAAVTYLNASNHNVSDGALDSILASEGIGVVANIYA